MLIGRREALLALVGLLAACKGRDAPGDGARARVVSISPSTTEAVFAIGGGADLVGRSRHCDFPPEAAKLPVVGGYADPSVEAILALAPTLVVGARGPAGPSLEQTLRGHSIATYFPETESMDQITAAILELGRLLQRDTGARAVVDAITARVRSVTQSAANRARVKVVLLFDMAPIVAAGPGGFPDELLRLAGGANVVVAGGAYPTFGLEHLLALDPDVILDGFSDSHDGAASKGVLGQRDAPGWRDLRAMREGRVRVLDSSAALRPGPRIGEGLEAIARALHGEAWSGAPETPPIPKAAP